ncbi:lantibiotic dehydratase [Paenibacillus campi]|uniref:lantibiotic dehydratase n=1 Tax=Paenibacillus campi TaxID=3106031 RepID=UPI002AFFD22C|nr:lantibiotic dehydratase [Paenibacillus sp. SGZ-1014]
MKSLFQPVGQYMVRLPLSPVADPTAPHPMQGTDEQLAQWCRDPLFREQILIASRTLYDTMNVYLNDPDKLTGKKKRNFVQAMLKYAGRRACRTTPFGLFTAVGVGQFAAHNQWTYDHRQLRKLARVDLEWLFLLIKRLEQECSAQLYFKLNPACYMKGDRAYLLYSLDGQSEDVQIRATPAFQILYEHSRTASSFPALVQTLLHHYPDTPAERIQQYVQEMVNQEFLISNLRPPLNVSDQFAFVIEQLESCHLNAELIAQLQQIQHMICNYNATEPGAGEAAYLQLVQAMQHIQSSASPLQIDTGIHHDERFTASALCLDKDIAEQMTHLASMLSAVAIPLEQRQGYWEQYKHKFIEKYGVDREVPLLEMLDTATGIGAPYSYTHPANDYFEHIQPGEYVTPAFKSLLLLHYTEAVQQGTPIEWTRQQFANHVHIEPDHSEVPVSLELNFLLRMRDGQPLLYVGPNIGSRQAGKTFGRFAHLSSSIHTVLEQIHSHEHTLRSQHDEQMCELSFIPHQIRSGNVTRNASGRAKEMALFTNSSRHTADQVSIDDIAIGIHNNRFYARHRRSGQLLVFGANNMLNPLMTANAIRFLQEMEEHRRRNWSYFPWTDVYKAFKYVPEIRYEGIVLSGAQWQINLYDLYDHDKPDGADFAERFQSFRLRYRLPTSFYIANSDHRLVVDTEDERSLHMLFTELRKAGSQNIQLVALEDGEPAVYDTEGRGYVAEVVVPFVRIAAEPPQFIQPKLCSMELEQQRLKMPLDDWLYIKLYGKQAREQELIAFELLDFCRELSAHLPVQHFFMRYMDPKPHIRLRFSADPATLLRMLPDVLDWLKGLKQQGLIAEYVIAAYDRELERYGGVAAIGAAERLFSADSFVVESIWRAQRLKQLPLEPDTIAIVSIIRLLQQLQLNPQQQLDILSRQGVSNSEYRTEFKQQAAYYTGLCDPADRWQQLSAEHGGKQLLDLLALRDAHAHEYSTYLQHDLPLTAHPANMIGSVLHLHCNRLLGTDRAKERRVLALTAHTLHALHSRNREGSLVWT